MYCTNNFTMFVINNNKGITGSKHIKIKYLIIKEKVKEGDITGDHISIDDMVADPLTKAYALMPFRDMFLLA